MATALRTTDQEIREAAIARGYLDAQVVVQNIPDFKHDFDAGRWFGLFVKFTAGDDWQLIGRRRSRGELLEMVEAKS